MDFTERKKIPTYLKEVRVRSRQIGDKTTLSFMLEGVLKCPVRQKCEGDGADLAEDRSPRALSHAAPTLRELNVSLWEPHSSFSCYYLTYLHDLSQVRTWFGSLLK